MLTVRIELVGAEAADQEAAAAELQSQLERMSPTAPATLQHLRVQTRPGAIRAIAFMAAPTLAHAERACARAVRSLATQGWQVTACQADFPLTTGWLPTHAARLATDGSPGSPERE
ncbi:hypothetical protein [Kitasatospora sp. NPDC089509]|uniref:hypothetical protein n=1 Tax=Kitasatospora sp. NPDC089509 TaxID=3364079 RepID=UPI00382F6050